MRNVYFVSYILARQQLRKKQEEENIFKTPPNLEEQKIIHDSFISKSPSDSVVNRKKMKDTVLKTVLICQPQVQLNTFYKFSYYKTFKHEIRS